MAEFEDICLEHVRGGVMRHDWRRFIRHDWERFLKPDWETRMQPGSSVAADMYHQLKAEQRRQRPAYYAQATRAEIAAEKAADEEHQADLAELRGIVADLKLDLLRREFARKAFNPSQPRVPAGNPDGGQWTSDGSSSASSLAQASPDRFEQMQTAADQPPRSDLSQLQDIANDPLIRARIDEAWNASSPHMRSPQEYGFWISRNETTGELFTRPFANPGSATRIVPGAVPNDAVAFFHTHPQNPDAGYRAEPSLGDFRFAADVGLPGLLQSHRGLYYFGPSFRPWRSR